MPMKWRRTCQECGAKGFYAQPNLESKSEAWRETKCRKCKSPALDFGCEVLELSGDMVDCGPKDVLPKD